jgi:cytochrome c oxidase subunit II
MALAIVLVVIVIGSVLVHLFNPWLVPDLASNWGSMDLMLALSFAVSGIVFVGVTLFIVVAIYRFRHREGHRAVFEPDNRKLEWWLIGVTTVGIVALLAPGLIVYYDFVRVPDDAMRVEVLGEQWRFTYRYPGEDGEFGRSHVRHVSADNVLGIDPDDIAGQDDILVIGGDLHLPVGQPIKVLLRSKDVIHSFFVPHFRAKMDMVPGMVTHFWFTPTVPGRYELVCAQHCGTNHFNMRGHVVALEQDEFEGWLRTQQSFGALMAAVADRVEDEDVATGRRLADQLGCMACHTVDGRRSVGPTWLGLYGSEVTLADGSRVVADEDYLRRAITNPSAELTQGFPNVMPAYDHLSADDIDALVAYVRAVSAAETPRDAAPAAEQPAQQPPVDPSDVGPVEATPEQGRALAQANGCFACHSEDGTTLIGPSFRGLYGREVELVDGSTLVADEDYIRRSILDPNAEVTAGFQPLMPPYQFSDSEIEAFVAYLRELDGE